MIFNHHSGGGEIITLFASGKGRRSETVGAKLGASPGPKGRHIERRVRPTR